MSSSEGGCLWLKLSTVGDNIVTPKETAMAVAALENGEKKTSRPPHTATKGKGNRTVSKTLDAAEQAREMACQAAEVMYEVAEIGIETSRQVTLAAVAAARQIGDSCPTRHHAKDESSLQKTKAVRDKAEAALIAAREGAEKAREAARQASGGTTIMPTPTVMPTTKTTLTTITTGAAALRVAEAAREAAKAAYQAAEITLAAAESAVKAVQQAFVDGFNETTYSDGQITLGKLANDTSASGFERIELSTTNNTRAKTTKKGTSKKKNNKKKERDMSLSLFSSERKRIQF